MPRLSRWTIRAAFVYLFLGFTVGALLLAHKGVFIHPALWSWLPVHVEFLLIGWILQLVMGVAFWIAPRFWQRPRRGNEAGAWVAVVLLNGGIWLVVGTAVWDAPAGVLFLGRVAEAGAVVAFARHLWPRIIPRTG